MGETKVGDRVLITTGRWHGHTGTVFSMPKWSILFTIRLDSPLGVLVGVLMADLEPIPDPAPLTPEEAQAAYDAAPAVPLSKERIEEIVRYATGKHPDPAPGVTS